MTSFLIPHYTNLILVKVYVSNVHLQGCYYGWTAFASAVYLDKEEGRHWWASGVVAH